MAVNISKITSAGGSVTVIGNGGGTGASTGNHGVVVDNGGEISAGDNGSTFGTVSVTGTGGATSGNSNFCVVVSARSITSSGGAGTVIGNGGGPGCPDSN